MLYKFLKKFLNIPINFIVQVSKFSEELLANHHNIICKILKAFEEFWDALKINEFDS